VNEGRIYIYIYRVISIKREPQQKPGPLLSNRKPSTARQTSSSSSVYTFIAPGEWRDAEGASEKKEKWPRAGRVRYYMESVEEGECRGGAVEVFLFPLYCASGVI